MDYDEDLKGDQMINTAKSVVNEVAEAFSVTFENYRQIGTTAEGWILCETDSGRMLLQEPTTGELIPAY